MGFPLPNGKSAFAVDFTRDLYAVDIEYGIEDYLILHHQPGDWLGKRECLKIYYDDEGPFIKRKNKKIPMSAFYRV